MYRGCNHGCIYCDSRSECYQVKNFDDDVIIKTNAIDLLDLELSKKKQRGIIGISGSMSDCYGSVDEDYELSRKALEVIKKHYFGVMIHTKSDLVLRDIDLLTVINERAFSNVLFTITTINDTHSKIIEPNAPVSSKRFNAIKQLSDQGITTGIAIWPILPFISDTPENIEKLLIKAKESGCTYAMYGDGVTLRGSQRNYFFNELDKHNKSLSMKYIKRYGDDYFCLPDNYKELKKTFKDTCKRLGLETRCTYKELNTDEQLSLF
jgi:DNA repair photolyase